MKIQRLIKESEVEIELTSDELFRAYSEQEHKFDIEKNSKRGMRIRIIIMIFRLHG